MVFGRKEAKVLFDGINTDMSRSHVGKRLASVVRGEKRGISVVEITGREASRLLFCNTCSA